MRNRITITAAITLLAALVFTGCMTTEQKNMMALMKRSYDFDHYNEYQVQSRLDETVSPTSFDAEPSSSSQDSISLNVSTITAEAYSEISAMAKMGYVQPNGVDGYSGWRLLADEGLGQPGQGPTPLSWMTTGYATDLLNHLNRAVEVTGLDVKEVRVECMSKFRCTDMMSSNSEGFLDELVTNIIIKSDEPAEKIAEVKNIALNAWVAGEGVANTTKITSTLVAGSENWDRYNSEPVAINSDISREGDLLLTQRFEKVEMSQYIEPDEASMGGLFADMSVVTWNIIAVAENSEDPEHAGLLKATTAFNTKDSETWVLYAEPDFGNSEQERAPTPLDYVTAGTAFCLTSQLTSVLGMMGVDQDDFRVEQQFHFRLDNPDTKEMKGYTDSIDTNILIESDKPEEELQPAFQQALLQCLAGEAFKNPTEMTTSLYLNGEKI